MSKPQDSNLEPSSEDATPVAPVDASQDWVTFVGDPFQSQTLSTPDSSEDGAEELPEEIPEEISDDSDEVDSAVAPLSLEEAAQEYIPEEAVPTESPSEDDLKQLAELSVAMAAQNEETLASLATIADPGTDQSVAQAQEAEIAEIEASEAATEVSSNEEPAPALELDLIEAQSCIEALLFISDKPLTAEKLHAALGEQTPFTLVQEALTALVDRYQGATHGFELTTVGGGYQFRTKPGRAHLAKQLAKVQTQKLSAGAMETLALIAYKQPVMKEEVDAIRGVDSSYFIRTLMDRKLIKITGRSDLPGRPMVYGTTQEFLELFGLKDLAALPSLRELEGMVPTSSVGQEDDPRVKQMRHLVSEMNHDVSVTLAYDPKEDDKFLSDIRDRVKSIPTTTATLVAQDEAAKAAREAETAIGETLPLEPQL